MRTTIDGGGRIVVPKRLRDEMGLRTGSEVEITAVDGRIVVEIVPTPVDIVAGPYGPVASTDHEMPVLTAELVRETLEQLRR